MHLVLVVPDLGLGGTQRVALALAGHWAALGRRVDVITICAEQPVYPLPDGVELWPLQVFPAPGIKSTLKRIRALRHRLTSLRPDVVLSMLTTTNVLAVLAGLGKPWRTVVSERSDPLHTPVSQPVAILRRLTYPLADAVVMQTATAARALGYLNRAVEIIPNPVTPMPPAAPADFPQPCVLGVGRLVAQKNFALLLDAFARVATRFPHWFLVIAGSGPNQVALHAQARQLGLEQRIHFPGLVGDMGGAYAAAALFVLSSRFEGFPNALCEAMAAGVPAIATDCPSGPSEIIRPGIDGLLVPVEDPDAMADAMARLMEDDGLRRRMGERASEIGSRFAAKIIFAKWRKVLEPSSACPPGTGISC